MYITSAQLSEILAWFESSTRFKFLLLFAAGDAKTAAFIGSVFDQKETVDVVSSSAVAVFLFAPQVDTAVSFNLGPGHFAFAQGVRLDASAAALSRRQERLPPETVSVQNYTDPGHREKIVRASVSATHELTTALGLGPKDVPAWVLFHRGVEEPMVVRTKGQDEIGQLLTFLKDLRQTEFKHVKAPRAAATSKRQRLAKARLHLEEAGRRLDEVLEVWRMQVGSTPPKLGLLPTMVTRENAIDVLKWPTAASSASKSAEAPLGEPDQHQHGASVAVREIVRQWQRCQSATKSIVLLESEISEYVAALDAAPSVLSHNEREVARLIQKYQALFQLRMVGAKLASFVRVVTGAGKQAQEITDVVGKLRKALGDDA